MTPVPEERPIPHEVPWREVEHEQVGDNENDWAFRSYPIGHTREQAWDGDAEDAKAWRSEMKRLEEARARLGGFGFR